MPSASVTQSSTSPLNITKYCGKKTMPEGSQWPKRMRTRRSNRGASAGSIEGFRETAMLDSDVAMPETGLRGQELRFTLPNHAASLDDGVSVGQPDQPLHILVDDKDRLSV